jgi:23S rRNA (adenine2030-N6)-methyltransferase
MYRRPYIHDDYVAGLEDTILHLLLSCVLNSRAESSTLGAYIDTHAGAGLYRLESIKKKQQDAQKYSSLLFFKANLKNTTTVSFRSRLRNLNRSSRAMRLYPGAPALAKAFCRSADNLVLSEQDPTIYHRLLRNTSTWSNIAVLKTDGFELARRTLLSPD